MTTGRQLFDSLLGGVTPPRPPFAPFVEPLAARVGGIGYLDMTGDATAWANNLAKTADLLGLDAVAVGFDTALTAESIAAADGLDDSWAPAGRLAAAMDTAERLFQTQRAARGCIAVMTGPLTLAGQLFGDQAVDRVGEVKQAQLAIAEGFCKARPDMLLFVESDPPAGIDWAKTGRRAYNALRNLVAHYNVATALHIGAGDTPPADGLTGLKMDFLVLAPGADDALTGAAAIGCGLALDLEDGEGAAAAAVEGILSDSSPWAGRPHFITSDGPLAAGADIEQLRAVSSRISTSV